MASYWHQYYMMTWYWRRYDSTMMSCTSKVYIHQLEHIVVLKKSLLECLVMVQKGQIDCLVDRLTCGVSKSQTDYLVVFQKVRLTNLCSFKQSDWLACGVPKSQIDYLVVFKKSDWLPFSEKNNCLNQTHFNIQFYPSSKCSKIHVPQWV